ncbi:DUF402 domain-containing protein [Halopenitus sp. H-Gu1]|uniref:DUF402 domain-containing protein n=1 Tax=Halopenitus sp. H-Gu1 TaxID=3242697 RepID=UPI00359D33CF
MNDGDEKSGSETDGTPPSVRIRGIYTTALTRLFLDAGHDVVDASTPIRERFDEVKSSETVDSEPNAGTEDGSRRDADREETGVYGPATVDASIGTTDDRQGVGIRGAPSAVEDASRLLTDIGIDALVWPDMTPKGGIFDGEVTETLGGGAVVRLANRPNTIADRIRETTEIGTSTADEGIFERRGIPGEDRPVEGYLPYDASDERIETGDTLRVQIRESAAPWTDHRPELGTEIRVPGTLVSLVPTEGVRVESHDEAAGRELAGMVDLLGLEPPDGWGVVWHRPAVDAGMDALKAGLSRTMERVETIAGIREQPVSAPRPLAFPAVGAWCWFGRKSRFELDDRRRTVTATMPGHHRVKAGSEAASAGVNFVEALCGAETLDARSDGDGDADAPEFPFEVVTDQFGPQVGDRIRIAHGKPAGHLIVLGEGDVTDLDPAAEQVTVERSMTAGGTYDALDIPREAGDVATTTFTEGRWWYPTTYRDSDGNLKGTYVNVCTPVEVFPESIRYVDLHVDVIKHADGTVERVDDDELDAAVKTGFVTEALAERARSVASAIENAL